MDTCLGTLVVLLFILGLITLVGHVSWVVLARLFGALFGTDDTSGERPVSAAIRDGVDVSRRPLAKSPIETEIGELESTARQLLALSKQGVLDEPTYERLLSHIKARMRSLLDDDKLATPVPSSAVLVAASAVEPPPLPPWLELERALVESATAGELPYGERMRIIALCRQIPEEQLAAMVSKAHLQLARVLARTAFIEKALDAYVRLLRVHPQDPGFGSHALEAARLAVSQDAARARGFLDRAMAAGLPAEELREAEALLRGLEEPTAEELPEAIPVDEPASPLAGAIIPFQQDDTERAQTAQTVPVIQDPSPPAVAVTDTLPASAPPFPVLLTTEPAPPPRPPRRSLGEMLAGFMEERNILWGELVGGLLMVGCSIALVISLWKTLEAIPYFPYLVLASITSALFGIGWYTLHHWKLESTSRGLLVIATLLVPLDFLVMAGLSRGQAGGLLQFVVELVSVALFTGLVGLAARVLVPDGSRSLTFAVVGIAASQLVFSRLAGAESTTWLFILLGTVPVAIYGGITARYLDRTARHPPLLARQTHYLFGMLGLSTFALGIALGLLVYLGGDVDQALQRLAVLVAIAGVPVLTSGLLIHRGLAEDPAETPLRTAGTAIGVAGMLVMLGAVGMAWPQPVPLILVCLLDFVALTVVAFRSQLPIAHVAALPCLGAGYLTAFHLLWGNLVSPTNTSMWQAAVSPPGGASLVVLALGMQLVAEWLTRTNRRQDGDYYAIGGIAVAVYSLALVSWDGAAEPGRATLVYAVYGIASLIANARWRRLAIGYLGLGLLLGATLWALWWGSGLLGPVWATVLALEALVFGKLATQLRRSDSVPIASRFEVWLNNAPSGRPSLRETYRTPLLQVCQWISLLAIGSGIWALLQSPGLFEFGPVVRQKFPHDWKGTWVIEHVLTGLLLLCLYVLLTRSERRSDLATAVGWLLIGTVTAGAGWLGVVLDSVHLGVLIGFCLSITSTLLVGFTLWGGSPLLQGPDLEEEGTASLPWYTLFAPVWCGFAKVAGMLAFAWSIFSLPSFLASNLPPFTLGFLTATAFLLAWGSSTPRWSWVGSFLIMGCLGHLWHGAGQAAELFGSTTMLSHASIVLAASLLVQACSRIKSELAEPINRIYAAPLDQSALVSSLFALPWLLEPIVTLSLRSQINAYAGSLVWLAAVWLFIAGSRRWPGLFSAFQAVLSLAVLYFVTGWLDGQPWVVEDRLLGLWDVRSLRAYGIGLGGLGLLWVSARGALRSHEVAQELFNPPWISLDRLTLGFLVVGQLLLAIGEIGPSIRQELTPLGRVIGPDAAGSIQPLGNELAAWSLLGLLGLVLLTSLLDRWPAAHLSGLLVLAITPPILIASQFAPEQATTAALRWGLGCCFLAVSALLWLRRPLDRLADALGCRLQPEQPLAGLLRWELMTGTALPILIISIVIANWQFAGQILCQPVPPSFFDRVGPLTTDLLPLGMVCLGLVGYALRERTAGYAFAAGLLADATLMAGQALQWTLHNRSIGAAEWVTLLQLGIVGSAVWAIGWLVSRRWVDAWRERPEAPGARPLMTVQLWLPGAGILIVLSLAVDLLVIAFADLHWTRATGSLLGWVAFGMTVAADHLRSRQDPVAVRLLPVSWVGFAAVGLLACSVERWFPGWGYRTLMVGWAVYALARAVADYCIEPSQDLLDLPAQAATVDQAVLLVKVCGLAVVFLAVKAVWPQAHPLPQEQLWSAGAVALASTAGAVLALSRRQEGWAFAAGVGFNQATSFLVWHVHRDGSLGHWWAHLVQGNVIASSIGALLWLCLRQRIYRRLELTVTAEPWLAAQIGFCFLGNALLLGGPLLLLFLMPSAPSALDLLGELWGWFALVLASAATWWYVGQVCPHNRTHILIFVGLELGVLLASSTSKWDTGDWLSYHVLTASWCLWGTLSLALGWGGPLLHSASLLQLHAEKQAAASRWLEAVLPPEPVRRWVVAISALLVGLALRGVDDPDRPYGSAAATLTASALAGALAVWTRRPRYVTVSGLLINLAGFFVWLVHGPYSLDGFVSSQILCLAFASMGWSVVEMALRNSLVPLDLRGGGVPFSHRAVAVGTVGLSLLIGLGLYTHMVRESLHLASGLTWVALTAVSVAVAICLWDATARHTFAGLYVISLLGIMLVIQHDHFSPRESAWLAAPLIAGQGLLTALIGWAAPSCTGLWRVLRLPNQLKGGPQPWFEPAQTAVAVVAGSLSVWILVSFGTVGERLVAPLACLFLTLGSMALAWDAPDLSLGHWRHRYETLTFGVLVVAELGWAGLDPAAGSLAWLHRCVLLMVALALMTLVYGVALTHWLPAGNSWVPCCRRMGPVLGLLASLVLLIVLGQEAFLYDPQFKRTPMAFAAVVVVAVALLGLIGAGISFAVVPGRDPFGLSERGRTAYVYGAEVLLVLLFVHLRLNVPELFRGFLGQYWTFIVMAIAFLGVGLSEFFERRGWRVLARPLQRTGVFLPLLPLLAFWLRPTQGMYEAAVQNVRGLGPLLTYLRNLPMEFDKHATLWLLAGVIYTFVAVTKRSFAYALLAALAANLGWWALLYHLRDDGLAFLVHPQLWLIPLAVILLVAEHQNRDRLGPPRSNALRYLALLLLYVSSSADMFIAGLGNSVVLPLVLAVLSVLGVLAGILLRVRAFLYLGVAFLFLVVFSMIWHAAVDQKHYWIWWASGIVLGGAILALFAVFEKRRDDMLRLMKELRHWE